MSGQHNQPIKLQRWSEVNQKLICQCGQCIAYLDFISEYILEREELFVRDPTRPYRETTIRDVTLHRACLVDFLDHKNNAEEFSNMVAWYYQKGLLGYFLCLKLKFPRTENKANRGEVRGRCLNCNIRHDLSFDYREDLLIRWVDAAESSKKKPRTA